MTPDVVDGLGAVSDLFVLAAFVLGGALIGLVAHWFNKRMG